jgi:hypothetical protein
MGVVYLASDQEVKGEIFAIKVLTQYTSYVTSQCGMRLSSVGTYRERRGVMPHRSDAARRTSIQ